MKHPKLMLNIPSLHESGCDHFPHFVMMAVLANMILDKDPDFEAMISRKVSQFIAAFGKEKEASEGGGRQWPKSHSTEEQSKAYRRDN